MKPTQTAHSANIADLAPPLVMQRQNPKWVGPIIAIFIPGAAHFLAGQRWTGILIYFALLFIFFLSLFPLSVPGAGFFYVAVGLFVASILFFVAVLISSWRPTRRIGCLGWLLFIGVILFVQPYVFVYPPALLMKTFVVELYVMGGNPMGPTLIAPSKSAPEVLIPDRVVVNKWIYRISDPQRGDIATFKTTCIHDDVSPTIFAKRIVGLPGETVDIASPYVLINGERLTEPPIFARIASRQDGFTGYYTAQEMELEGIPLPLTLGPDEYFVMGDNSPWSVDSRFLGPVLRQDITGKAIRIYYPFDRVRELE